MMEDEEKLLLYDSVQAVDVQQFIRCQIAKGIHCSTIIVRLSEEAKSQAHCHLLTV